MFGLQVVEVAIGIAFFYLVVSLGFTALNEWFAALSHLRARGLQQGIANLLLHDGSMIESFYGHPLIRSLQRKTGKPDAKAKMPAGIPARLFAITVVDIAAKTTESFGEVRSSLVKQLEQKPDSALQRQLLALFDAAGGDMRQALADVEQWFDSQMERIRGWYKRRVMFLTGAVALIAVSLVNADTIMIARQLWSNSALREATAALAERQVNEAAAVPAENLVLAVSTLSTQLCDVGFPLGWSSGGGIRSLPTGPLGWIAKVLGIVFTTLAVTLGAPFWFDLLQKFVRVRSSGDTGVSQGAKRSGGHRS